MCIPLVALLTNFEASIWRGGATVQGPTRTNGDSKNGRSPRPIWPRKNL